MGDIVQPCGFCPAQRRPANHVRRGTEQHLVGFAVCRSQQAARLHNIRPVLFLLLRPRLRGIGWMPEVSAPAGGSRGMSKVPPHPAKAIFSKNRLNRMRSKLSRAPGKRRNGMYLRKMWAQGHGYVCGMEHHLLYHTVRRFSTRAWPIGVCQSARDEIGAAPKPQTAPACANHIIK